MLDGGPDHVERVGATDVLSVGCHHLLAAHQGCQVQPRHSQTRQGLQAAAASHGASGTAKHAAAIYARVFQCHQQIK